MLRKNEQHRWSDLLFVRPFQFLQTCSGNISILKRNKIKRPIASSVRGGENALKQRGKVTGMLGALQNGFCIGTSTQLQPGGSLQQLWGRYGCSQLGAYVRVATLEGGFENEIISTKRIFKVSQRIDLVSFKTRKDY